MAGHTGWSREFLLWELEYVAGLGLQATILRSEGAWVVPWKPPPAPVSVEGIDDLLMA